MEAAVIINLSICSLSLKPDLIHLLHYSPGTNTPSSLHQYFSEEHAPLLDRAQTVLMFFYVKLVTINKVIWETIYNQHLHFKNLIKDNITWCNCDFLYCHPWPVHTLASRVGVHRSYSLQFNINNAYICLYYSVYNIWHDVDKCMVSHYRLLIL